MEKILQSIIQSEDEALRLENNAKQQSLVILTEANKKASEILEKSVLEGETLSEELLQKARDEAINETNLKSNSKIQSLEQIRLKSKERLQKAADYITEKVVN